MLRNVVLDAATVKLYECKLSLKLEEIPRRVDGGLSGSAGFIRGGLAITWGWEKLAGRVAVRALES